MVALKLTYEFPPLTVRGKEDVPGLVNSLRSLINTLKKLHIRTAEVANNHQEILTPLEGSGAPATAPSHKGQHYIDTALNKVYFAVDTTGSGDWIALN